MPVIFPSIKITPAQTVISAMRRLKSRRFNHEISRAKFLYEFGVLRDQLNETEEYKTLRRTAIARAKGMCEKCHEVPGEQLCHISGVSFRPDLALRLDNVYWGCLPCHQLDHPDLQLT